MVRFFKALFIALAVASPAFSYVNLSGAWWGNGGDKVAKQDLWPKGTCSTCAITSVWDGTTIKEAGFKNEMIGGMLWLQGGASADATSVSVQLSPLTGPSGSVISSTGVLCANVTDYTTRDFEIFVATYVPILGMTTLSWAAPEFEERDLPLRFQNPYTVNGNNDGIPNSPNLWTTRPDANKYYPDGLIPQECKSTYTVYKSSSQGIWIDWYLRKDLNAGVYTGTLTVKEGVTVSTTIPVSLTVYNGTMPDTPYFPYMADVSEDDINFRLNGVAHGSSCATTACINADKEFYKAMHRHRIIPAGDVPDISTNFFPSARYVSVLDGTLFSSANGYAGPGTSTGIPVYSLGTYGHWRDNPNWSTTNAASFCTAISSWTTYMKTNFPTVRTVMQLEDEPTDLTNVNKYSTWMATVTACQVSGYKVHSWVTNDWTNVLTSAPYVDNPASTDWISKTATQANWNSAAAKYITSGSTQAWAYNGHPPYSGTANATEASGVDPWVNPWAAYKQGVQGWFQWGTSIWNIQGNGTPAENPLWDVGVGTNPAKTFGYLGSSTAVLGASGFNYANGDGNLVFPGVDTYATAASLGFQGPVATLRLKLIRRGINDYDYITMANAVNSSSTTAIVNAQIPKALWAWDCFDHADCSYVYGGVQWPTTPDTWEVQRANLATIIQSAPTPPPASGKSITAGGIIFGHGTIQ